MSLEQKTNSEQQTSRNLLGIISSATELYFAPKPFEKEGNGQIYKKLGVHRFKKYIPWNPENVFKLLGFNYISREQNLEKFLLFYEKITRTIEVIHGVSGVILGVLPIYVFSAAINQETIEYATEVTAVNAIINVYPFMIQRYNRTRIYNLLDKINKRKKTEPETEESSSGTTPNSTSS